MADIFNLADTWNAVGTTWNGIMLDVINTASAAASRLLNLKVGGTSVFAVDVSGNISYKNVGSGTVSFSQPTQYETNIAWSGGLYSVGCDNFSATGSARLGSHGWGSGLGIANNGTLVWDQAAAVYGFTFDVALGRQGAGILSQRPGPVVVAQAYRVYSVQTDTSNGEWSEQGFASSVPYIRAMKNGSGTQRALTFGAGAADHLKINTDGTVNVNAATATPAGGSTAARLLFGTTSGFGIYYGSGAPTSLTAAQGSLYLRSDGSSSSTRLYVNSTGAALWVNFTSAS